MTDTTGTAADGTEPTREELLDNTPEAVAMRRARAARAEAAARLKAAEERMAAKPSTLRRKLILGGVLGLGTAARVITRAGRFGGGRRP